ncbi:MAG: DUF917 domain-containing protein [Chloroflexi bacterium]|nr:DUF917 domain-containing protein [Chloroflexota bacterium]
MSKIALTADDITPLLEGLAVMGTGGGGNPSWGRMILENDVAHGRAWNVVPLEDVPDDWTIVCGGMMGSVKAIEAIGFDRMLEGWEEDFPLLRVTRYMEQLLGKHIDAVVPFEAGGLNSPVILTLAARMGIAAIDGDALGRSAPETQMTSWHGNGVEVTPMPLADSYGNIVVVSKAVEPTYVDEIGRVVVTKGGHLGANNHHPRTGAQRKATTIPGTCSRALAIGKAVLAARDAGHDPVQPAADVLGAKRLLQGRVTALAEEERMGFYFTQVTVAGTGEDAGHTAQITIKNETMLCKLDGRVVAIFPDPIYLVEPGTGRGIMSVELAPGMDIALLSAPAHPRLSAAAMTPAGRKAMSPARFGHPDLEYRPLEALSEEQ